VPAKFLSPSAQVLKLCARFAMKSSGHLFVFLFAAVFLAAAPARAVSTVVLDPGHGGHDRGGMPGQRYSEKIYTLDMAQRVGARLREAGFRVVMTRSTDDFISLGQRCAIANSQRNAVFVSLHFNGAPREGANGIETYYYSRKSARLASELHRRIVQAAGTENRFVRQRGFYVIRHTSIPSVLCELGFLTNSEEGSRIVHSATHRQRLADAVAGGIIALYR
jgi:N-acetylmuramoyl-L-alanine amidase